jgi:glucans biosynthesis protein C
MNHNPWNSQTGSEVDPLLQRPFGQGNTDQDDITRRLDELMADLDHITYIDNLRVFLTILVVFHHAATAYGGIWEWFFSSSTCGVGSSNALLAFTVLNWSFVPALFFIISGYFSKISLRRKGAIPFVKDRLRRLGIPLVLYVIVINPLMIVLSFPLYGGNTGKELGSYFLSIKGANGTVWYIALLLFFDLALAVYSWLPFPYLVLSDLQERRFYLLSAASLGAVILISYFIRTGYPLGVILHPFGVLTGLLPQFILAYVAGTTFSNLEPYLTYARYPWLNLAWRYTLSIVTLIILVLINGRETIIGNIRGGWNASAFFYEAWNEMSFFLLGAAWLTFFFYIDSSESGEWEKKVFSFRRYLHARYSYAVYLIHPIILSVLQVWLEQWGWWATGPIPCLWKAVITGTIALVASWVVSRKLVESVPEVANVI